MKSIAIISKGCLSVLIEVGPFVAALLVCVSDRCDTTVRVLGCRVSTPLSLTFPNSYQWFFFSELTTEGLTMQSSENFGR